MSFSLLNHLWEAYPPLLFWWSLGSHLVLDLVKAHKTLHLDTRL